MSMAKLGYSDLTNAPSEFLLMMADLSWCLRLRDGSEDQLIDVRNNYSLYLSGAIDVIPLRVFLRLGATMAELGEMDSATSIYRRGCKECPQHSSVWKGLGMCLMQMTRYKARHIYPIYTHIPSLHNLIYTQPPPNIPMRDHYKRLYINSFLYPISLSPITLSLSLISLSIISGLWKQRRC